MRINQLKRLAVIAMFFLLPAATHVSGRTTSSVNKEVLEALRKRAAETHSTAMVILKDNQLVDAWYSGERGKIELMSSTKSIVSLGIGRLIEMGKIKSLDQPVHEFYPEWKQGRKKLITIRHLLNHTSGLQNVPLTTLEIYPSPDLIKLALSAELSDEPGSKFSYNNKAVNLLAGVINVASGKRMDLFFKDEFFQPMGITDFAWQLDPAGNPHAMSGLQIHAVDLAKFGQLVLDKGMWNGKRIVSEKWIEESMKPGQAYEPMCGLLWWLKPDYTHYIIDDKKLKELEAGGLDKSFLEKLAPLVGKKFESLPSYEAALTEVLGADWGKVLEAQKLREKGLTLSRKIYGEAVGYSANGYLGQYLVIYPKERLVAVRQVRASKSYNPDTDGFNDFMDLVRALAS